jgi:hypothetical protein
MLFAREDHAHPSDTSRVAKAGDTMTGDLTIQKSTPLLVLNKTAGDCAIHGRNGGSLRWGLNFANSVAETGGNAGSDFELVRCSDAGAYLASAFQIVRSSGNVSISSLTASTSSTTGALTVAGGVGIGGTLTVGAVGGGVSVKPWGVDPAYNAISLNNDVSAAGMIGVIGGNASDQNIYYATPAGAGHQFRVNNANVALVGPAGVVVGAPTGGSKGTGTINAVAVYDDNVLLTCVGVQYLKHGEVDLAQWDALSPVKHHRTAHRFVELVKTFDPRDPKQYIDRMLQDEALPGMPTMDGWRHGDMSLGEMHNRLWLATELLASAFVGLHNDYERRLAALEKRIA